MDKEVYSNVELGKDINANFISIKFQIDTNVNDNAFIRNQYADASAIRKKYEVFSLPTFLFFAPNGTIVHKGVGYHDTLAFRFLAMSALDANRQYYRLMTLYNQGQLDYAAMRELAIIGKRIGDKYGYKIGKRVCDPLPFEAR